MTLSSGHSDIGISINFQEELGMSPFEALNSTCLSRCQRDVRPPVQIRWILGLSLGSPQGIETLIHLVRRKMSLHSRHCSEIWPSFE